MRFVRFYVFKRNLNDVIKRFVKAVQFEIVVSFSKKSFQFVGKLLQGLSHTGNLPCSG